MRKDFLYRNGKRPCLHSRCLYRLESFGGLLSLASLPRPQSFLCHDLSNCCALRDVRDSSLLGEQRFWLAPSSPFDIPPWHAVNPLGIWMPLDHLLLRKARSVWRYFSMSLHWTHSKFIVPSRHIIDICICYFYALSFLCGHVDNITLEKI